MYDLLARLRSLIPASYRGTAYAAVAAIAPALIAWGVLDEEHAAAIVGVLLALVTLAFAVLHSTSSWRSALYAALGAVTVALAVYGWGNESQWDAILAIVAPVLGLGVAGANTPAGPHPAIEESSTVSPFVEEEPLPYSADEKHLAAHYAPEDAGK